MEMTNSEEAQRAIEAVNGQDLGGRALSVNEPVQSPNGVRGGADLAIAALTAPAVADGRSSKISRCPSPVAIKHGPIEFGGRI